MKAEAILDALEYLLQKETEQPKEEREEMGWLRRKVEKLIELARTNGELDGYQLVMRIR